LIAVCGLIAALIAAQPVLAKDKAKSHKDAKPARGPVRVAVAQKRSAAVKVKPSPPPKQHPWVGRNVTISPSERDTIRAYVRNRSDASKLGKPNGVPQGLAKKVSWFNNLPEGWQNQCVRGQVLPDAVHKHCQPLPEELTLKLPPPPPGTVLLAVDGKIVRLGYPTYEILDTFDVALHSKNPHVHWVTVAQASGSRR
jgi:hypothetical protein